MARHYAKGKFDVSCELKYKNVFRSKGSGCFASVNVLQLQYTG